MNTPDELIVVVPEGFDLRHVSEIVRSQESWIATAGERIHERERREQLQAATPMLLPSRIELPALDQVWSAVYRNKQVRQATLEVIGPRRIQITAPKDKPTVTIRLLQLWLVDLAKHELVPELLSLAEEHGYDVRHTTVRSQKTRWASCSRAGTISLNCRLLLLPPDLVRYVMLHELAHLREMNHSARFWAVVDSLVDDVAGCRKRLRVAERQLPAWLQFDHSQSF
jgi:predicted metal-dependent hydrolase